MGGITRLQNITIYSSVPLRTDKELDVTVVLRAVNATSALRHYEYDLLFYRHNFSGNDASNPMQYTNLLLDANSPIVQSPVIIPIRGTFVLKAVNRYMRAWNQNYLPPTVSGTCYYEFGRRDSSIVFTATRTSNQTLQRNESENNTEGREDEVNLNLKNVGGSVSRSRERSRGTGQVITSPVLSDSFSIIQNR